MRVLVIGYSSIVQRRVLPALEALSEITAIDVASRRGPDATRNSPGAKLANVFDDYATALEKSDAELVYISTVNSEHFRWAEAALRRGFHTVVDKPAATTLEEAARLAAIASENGRCLAEATVYPFHAQIEESLRIAGNDARHLIANISCPPLPADDFRNRRDLGGGAFLDMCRYAASPGRVFFGIAPLKAHCVITRIEDGGHGTDTGFSVLLVYPGGRTATGHFGFDTQYRNHLTVLGEKFSIELTRVFSPPPDLSLPLQLSEGTGSRRVDVAPSNSFANFLLSVVRSLNDGSWSSWATILLEDARTTELLRTAAEEN